MKKTVTSKSSQQSKNLLSFNHLGQCYKPLKKALAQTIQQSTQKNTQQKITKPFFILLGQPESGKNTFITSAEEIISTQEIQLHNKLPACTLYHGQQANWIKIPGDYLVKLDEQGKRTLCNAIKKAFNYYKTEITLSGTVIILDLYDMLTRSKFSNDNRLNQINQFLIALNYIYNKPFSVNFFLNKCDLIPGFFEFFGNRNKEFRDQAWSFPLQQTSEEILKEEFNTLIKKLNEQLIWRLRHETQADNLSIIKEFPLKIEQLKVRLTPLFSEHLLKLQSLVNLQFSELHLISCRQFNILETSTNNNALSLERVKPDSTSGENALHKNFFIKNSYQNIINDQKELNQKNTPSKLAYFSFILLCIAIISGCIVFLSHQLSENIRMANQTHIELSNMSKDLLTNKSVNRSSLISKTKQLKNINNFVSTLQQQQHSFPGSQLLFYKSDSNLNQSKAIRNKFIASQWLPTFANHLQEFIQENLKNNPEKTYIALKIYLMLGSEQPNTNLDVDYINQHLSQILPPSTFIVISQLPTIITAEQLPKISLNNAVVDEARAYLSTLQTEQLAYVLLYSKIDLSKDINLNKQLTENKKTNNKKDLKVLITNEKNSTIPAIYTKIAFDRVMTLDIPSAANEALIGNKIIGTIVQDTEKLPEQFIEKLRKEYVKTYADIWQQALQHTRIAPSYNLTQFSQQLKLLSSANSPLLTLLKTIYENTHFELIEKQSSELANLNNVLLADGDKNSNPLFNSFIAIRHLGKSTLKISSSEQPGEAAFQQLRKQLDPNTAQKDKSGLSRLISSSNQLPNPLRLWMITLSNHYYQLLAKQAGNYINKIWLDQISQPFHKTFSTQYPFKNKSTSDIGILTFNHFFSRGGVLDKFESEYILPFLSQNQQGWGVNLRIASTLQIPHDVMLQLQNLAEIQTNYFGKKSNSADIEFNASISKLPDNIKSISFSNGAETINLVHDNNKASNISWPVNDGNSNLTIIVTTKDNQTKTIEFDGAWSWLKAIDELSITSAEKNKNTNSENNKIKNNEITLLIPSSTESKVEVTLQFEAGNKFDHNLLSNTWMPYWVFKVR